MRSVGARSFSRESTFPISAMRFTRASRIGARDPVRGSGRGERLSEREPTAGDRERRSRWVINGQRDHRPLAQSAAHVGRRRTRAHRWRHRRDRGVRTNRVAHRLPSDGGRAAGWRNRARTLQPGGRAMERDQASVGQGASGATPSRLSADESATVGNKGQIAEGRSPSVPVPDRRTFQDFVLNAGLKSSQQQGDWALTTQSNYVGVTRRQEALRFGARGDKAPMLDLSDYSIGARSSSVALNLGQVSFGNSRHLANNFTTPGSMLSITSGATTVSLGALSGSSQVGWDDLTGLERPTDRVFGAAIGRELLAAHPGALRLDVNLLDGSKQPRPAFTQSAVVDAEQSDGGSVQLSAALPNQRMRLTGGYTRATSRIRRAIANCWLASCFDDRLRSRAARDSSKRRRWCCRTRRCRRLARPISRSVFATSVWTRSFAVWRHRRVPTVSRTRPM